MSIDVYSYRVFVEPLVEKLGSGFVAYAPDLTGCVSDGETPDEALHNVYDAIRCWLEAAQEKGLKIPAAGSSRHYA